MAHFGTSDPNSSFALFASIRNLGVMLDEAVMKNPKTFVIFAAVVVLAICVYVFFLSNEVFSGQFKSDAFNCYFMTNGIFCSVSLICPVASLKRLQKRAGNNFYVTQT